MSVELLGQWLTREALPVWASIGFDPHQDQFVEEIGFDCQPLLDAPRRVMVQARQIFSYGLACERGWFDGGDELALRAYRQMVHRYADDASGSNGWGFSTDREGRIVDPTRDLYAQAFVLLALAKIAKIGGIAEPLMLARNTIDFLDASMASPDGGYLETLPSQSGLRRQNPHMHLLEAFLAWHAVAPDAGFDKRALDMAELLKSRFLIKQGPNAALVEFFDESFAPLGGPDFAFEPGHHFEWVWLLHQLSSLCKKDFSTEAENLWRSALKYGFRNDGAIFDLVSLRGRVMDAGTRLWPLTEALKAFHSNSQAAVVTPRTADQLAQTLLTNFILPANPGLWLDHFDNNGLLKKINSPASSLYHICCAMQLFR